MRRKGETAFGTRCEIKNVNSIRFIVQAIEYESRRQVDVLENGGTVDQETRLWDTVKGETRPMRSKEEAHDYRYFPDPDLLPLVIEQSFVDEIAATLPELPDEKKDRLMAQYGLSVYDAMVLTAEKANADYFEAAAKGRDGKLVCNWVTSALFGALKKLDKDITESPISPDELGGLVDLIADETISGKIAKDVFDLMLETGKSAAVLVEEKGLRQVTDMGAITGEIDKILAANQDKVEQYRGGKDKLFGFFVGQVMKAMGGKANPEAVNKVLHEKLD
ncbi:MAG: Asp-tRNA(Asn)/Glu-tRNA(Gln) amidotransferase subunit GatB, partial [Bdellovibrionales bacterium]